MKPDSPAVVSPSRPWAFSLIEMLVAMGVLSLMMVFLFNLVGQTLRAWEGGSKQVEAAQAARIGLETMAQDLQFALGGSAVSLVGTNVRTNIVPFFSTNNATARLGLHSALNLAPSSGQIFAVAPLAAATNALHELGYMSVFVTRISAGEGYHDMRGRRYVLMRHTIPGTHTRGDFFYANTFPADQTAPGQWLTEVGNVVPEGFRTSLIPNCYQLKFSYASNNGGVLAWSTNWSSQTSTPAGVLVTAKVMDEKTAARIAVLRSNGLTAADVAEGALGDVPRILREGTVEVSRFIPFVNARP
jgi:type II secretory pathway pseudopilin PulG